MRIIGIETSCDETGIAIYDSEQGLLGHALHSQIALHAEYGGVVPELASRDHVRKIVPLLKEVMAQTGVNQAEIDGIAYTEGPGLVGALLVGAAVGRSIAWAWGVPHVGVHHMEGHLLAPMLEDNPPEFPFIALLVSGGHCMLVRVNGVGEYTILGDTLDDAVGEAFDKTAKLLGLGYPGGPAIEAMAKKGLAGRFKFPRPMVNRPGLDFSFSGLKTFSLNTWQQLIEAPSDDREQDKADVAHAFQTAVVDTLRVKCQRAIRETGVKRLVLAGGVSANIALREAMAELVEKEKAELFYPRMEFCTDNGAMIAYAGYRRLAAMAKNSDQEVEAGFNAKPRWSLETLTAP